MTINETRILLGGSRVDLLELPETLESISSRLIASAGPPLAVTSINLDHIHHFGAGSPWTGTLDATWAQQGEGDIDWLNLIDGAPLAAQARRLTGHSWPRLAGSDLIGPILDLAELRGSRIAFLGGTDATHRQLRSELGRNRPGLQVAGYWAPAREDLADTERSDDLATEIRATGAELLIVGLGKPRQELWIAEHGIATGARVLLAFGAVVDFLAGRVSRAPHWLADHGMEWAWRLALEPKRLSTRYLVDGPPAYLAVRRTSETSAIPVPHTEPIITVTPPGVAGSGFVGAEGSADVAVIVIVQPTDQASRLPATLASLRQECRDLRLRVIISGAVDNGSPIAAGAGDTGGGLLIATGCASEGRAGAVNAAREHLGTAETVLVVAAGSTLEPGAIRAMITRMNRSAAGAVAPKLLRQDGTVSLSLLREPTLSRAMAGPLVGRPADPAGSRRMRWSDFETAEEAYQHAHKVKWATGACLLVRRDVHDALGDCDERFTGYSEETDYFRRIRETGADIWFEPEARVLHEDCPPDSSPELAALLAYNRLRYSRVHHSAPYAIAVHIAVAANAAARIWDPAQRRVLLVSLGLRAARSAVVPAAHDRWKSSHGEMLTAAIAAGGGPRGAIIIPAHNEEGVIERTLAALAPLAVHGLAEIIVVCNGCSDATASVARRFAGITVREMGTASKPSAMNAGDRTAHAWPRLYLDADIEADPEAVMALFDVLQTGRLLAARPASAYDTDGAAFLVRRYYRARSRIPVGGVLWGAGGYAITAEGHARFGTFPELTADDSFVDGVFTDDEKVVLPTAPLRVRTPRTTQSLLAVLTRQRRGAVELGDEPETAARVQALLSSIRGPGTALDAGCYLMLTVIARRRSRKSARARRPHWERDLSTRALTRHPSL